MNDVLLLLQTKERENGTYSRRKVSQVANSEALD
jgi:hypothetical protein